MTGGAKSAIEILTSPVLEGLPGIVHGFSTRPGGVSPPPYASLNVSASTGDTKENARKNRELLAGRLGIPAGSLMTIHQVLGSDVVEIDSPTPTEPRPKADAMITRLRGTFLTTLSADCVLILLCAPNRGVVANAHASWRGTVGEIARTTVRMMAEKYAVDPRTMRAAISPCIGGCCFEVREEVASRFDHEIPYSRDFRNERDGRIFLDLAEINRAQLLLEGLREEQIHAQRLCTKCHPDLLYSYRRDGERTGRFCAVIGIRG